MNIAHTARLKGLKIVNSRCILLKIEVFNSDGSTYDHEQFFPLFGKGLYFRTIKILRQYFTDCDGWLSVESFNQPPALVDSTLLDFSKGSSDSTRQTT